mgnify:CR=1 FL=1
MQPPTRSKPGVISHVNKVAAFVDVSCMDFTTNNNFTVMNTPAIPCSSGIKKDPITALEFELNVDKNETKEKIYKTKSSSVSTVLICVNPILMSIFSH